MIVCIHIDAPRSLSIDCRSIYEKVILVVIFCFVQLSSTHLLGFSLRLPTRLAPHRQTGNFPTGLANFFSLTHSRLISPPIPRISSHYRRFNVITHDAFQDLPSLGGS